MVPIIPWEAIRSKPFGDMHMRFQIQIATGDKDILDTYPVMRQLRPHIKRSLYLGLVRQQEKEVRFQLASLKANGKIACVAGFRLCRSLGWGKYLYVDDLVTDEKTRSKGAGKAMFAWLVRYARRHKCDELRLDSAVYRHGAHRFYLRERMDIACFNFRLPLND